MVERMHRTLKTALTASCTNSSWTTRLPWVLLGLRTTPKDPDDISIAEKVYGDALQVPGDFFSPGSHHTQEELRKTVDKFVPCQPTFSNRRPVHIPQDLKTASHVFIRVDSVKPPLTQPYSGPFKVLRRSNKSYEVDVRGNLSWISIDRLKPAYLPPPDQPTSRFGRPLRQISSLGGVM